MRYSSVNESDFAIYVNVVGFFVATVSHSFCRTPTRLDFTDLIQRIMVATCSTAKSTAMINYLRKEGYDFFSVSALARLCKNYSAMSTQFGEAVAHMSKGRTD